MGICCFNILLLLLHFQGDKDSIGDYTVGKHQHQHQHHTHHQHHNQYHHHDRHQQQHPEYSGRKIDFRQSWILEKDDFLSDYRDNQLKVHATRLEDLSINMEPTSESLRSVVDNRAAFDTRTKNTDHKEAPCIGVPFTLGNNPVVVSLLCPNSSSLSSSSPPPASSPSSPPSQLSSSSP